MQVDTLIEAGWVIPIQPRGTVLPDHAVAIDRGRIVALLPAAQARACVQARTHVRLPGQVLMPGFVNLHTHASMSLLRGVGDDLPLMRWLNERIWPLERALVSNAFVYDGARLAALEMLRGGTTCCSDMYFFPEAAARGMRSLGMRCAVGAIAIEFPSSYAADAEDYLSKGLAARDAFRGDPLVSFTLAPHAPYTVSDATLTRIAMLSEELDLPVHIHLHETAYEVDESLATIGVRPLERLERLGLVNERLIAVHAVHLLPAEIELLAARGASVAHCPASNLKLASGFAPVAALRAAGVNVGIGTDGAASNDRLDMMSETRLGALLGKAVIGDAAALPAAEVLECATLAGARALGLETCIGSIEVGKNADLIAIDLEQAETIPLFDPIAQLVYSAGRESVSHVWIDGEPVVQMRQLAKASVKGAESDINRLARAWQNKAQQFLEGSAS
ncbi:MAG: TRZ/ATZ family hydrolase [Burkholderiaceae bacterium]